MPACNDENLTGECTGKSADILGTLQGGCVAISLLTWEVGCCKKELFTLLDLCVSSLRRGHANLLCIVPILTDDPRRESETPFAAIIRTGGRTRQGNHPVRNASPIQGTTNPS